MITLFDIMIIDDDVQVRERLKSIIDWESLSVRLVCEAGDSDSAMELYLLNHPQIVVTDINIPIINGLDLAGEMLKDNSELRFIVITGYNDFELARKALNLPAVSLLSKPIFPDDINDSLRKAIRSIEDEREKNSSLSMMQQLIRNNLPQLQESFMANLLKYRADDETVVRGKIAQLKIPCTGPYYVVALIEVSSSLSSLESREAMTMLLRDRLAASLCKENCTMYSFTDSHFRLNCVISTQDPNPDNFIEESVTKIREQMKFIQNTKILAGIGPTVSLPTLLHESYFGALAALKYQAILGNEPIAHYKNLERTETVLHEQEPIYHYLRQMFRTNNLESITATIQNQLEKLSAGGRNADKQIRNFFFEYVSCITDEALRLGLEWDQMSGYAAVMGRLFQKNDPQECTQDVLRLTRDLINQLFSRHDTSTNHLVLMAKDYIEKNLHDKLLNLDKVSDYVGLSRIYFCKLFHQIEGVGFSTYLKDERIRLAKKLLRTTNLRVFEVAEASGFSNAKYFSYVFRQEVGQTPVEYQKREYEVRE